MSYDVSSLINIALNQTCKWEKKLSINYFGEDEFAEAKVIKCRVSYKDRKILNAKGEEINSGAQITTLDKVEVGDRIEINGDKRLVISVTKPSNFDGIEHRRKVYV